MLRSSQIGVAVLATLMMASVPGLAQSRQSSPEGDGATRDFGFFSRFRPKSTAKPRTKPVYRRKGAALDATKVVPDAAIGLTFTLIGAFWWRNALWSAEADANAR